MFASLLGSSSGITGFTPGPGLGISANPTATTNAAAPVTWEWLEQGPMWVPYDQNTSALIEQGFTSGQPTASFNVARGGRHGTGAQYVVDLDSMTQVNQGTGFVRHVRRFTVSCSRVWEFDSGTGYIPYPPESSEQLEVAKNSGRTQCTLHTLVPGRHSARSYLIDLVSMTQTSNHSGNQRSVRISNSQPAGPPGSVPQLSSDTIQTVLSAATSAQDNITDEDTCPVCLDSFEDEVGKQALQLEGCNPGHYFHQPCIEQFLQKKPQCPCCFKFFGLATGDQPQGQMRSQTHRPGKIPLSGFETVGTIVITYTFPDGLQSSIHPNPGQHYQGTSRVAYLPDTPEGREVHALLKKCFDQKLTFTIGTSITTGLGNCVIWNGVHHKTQVSGGETNFGYPDPTYFARVKGELKAKGIF